ncbi:hypothetical protein ABR737_41340 [Streptomyces sp. Edi2]|uniref:hypothetical protein n=1 Tax=Streptomyces sp. Edi2 TaxID=3162528 RepID=UPI0033068E15
MLHLRLRTRHLTHPGITDRPTGTALVQDFALPYVPSGHLQGPGGTKPSAATKKAANWLTLRTSLWHNLGPVLRADGSFGVSGPLGA